jgi:hypothetical protein
MGKWLENRNGYGQMEARRLPLDLKRCPLCGTINAASNSECVTCCWHGEFEKDPETIEEGLYEMMLRCPELAEALLERPEPAPRPFSLWNWLTGLFRRRVDFRI